MQATDAIVPPVVAVEDVTYRYPGSTQAALDGVRLTIERGEFVGLIGPTGAGKSTLCLALNGIVPHFFGGEFYGRLLIEGKDSVEHPTHELARSAGMVLEDPEMQLTAPTVRAEVAFGLENACIEPGEIRSRLAEALAAVGLAGLEDKHPAQLSGGQKQRLAIASALALRPPLLVLDEPTSQLDPTGAREVMALLREVNRGHGLAVLLVSHDAEALAEHAGRVVLLAAGRVVADGPPARILGDVALMGAHGLRPPQVTQVFRCLGSTAAPVTLDAALALAPRLEPRPARAGAPAAVAAAPGPAVLEAAGLHHAYPDGTVALRGVDVAVRRGEYVALVGQNGGGKSTLVRHFLRLLEPSAGHVAVMGEDVAGRPVSDLARRIGYVAQNPDHQLFASTVRREVGFALQQLGTKRDEVERRVEAALGAMRLGWAADRHPLSLSKGDRSRVVVAAVTVMEPELLIFDEPTTGQDHAGAVALLDLTRELHRAGRTVLVVTHHLHLLAGYAERLLVMAGGRLVLDAPLRAGLYAADALAGASVEAPQVVRFATAIGAASTRPLTPEELAAGLAWREAAA